MSKAKYFLPRGKNAIKGLPRFSSTKICHVAKQSYSLMLIPTCPKLHITKRMVNNFKVFCSEYKTSQPVEVGMFFATWQIFVYRLLLRCLIRFIKSSRMLTASSTSSGLRAPTNSVAALSRNLGSLSNSSLILLRER